MSHRTQKVPTPKKLRDRRSGLSSYNRHGKIPYKYSTTPLNKLGEGAVISAENIARFNERLGISITGKFTNPTP